MQTPRVNRRDVKALTGITDSPLGVAVVVESCRHAVCAARLALSSQVGPPVPCGDLKAFSSPAAPFGLYASPTLKLSDTLGQSYNGSHMVVPFGPSRVIG